MLPSEQLPNDRPRHPPKIEAGDARRARPVIAVEVLRQLGILSADDLADVSPMPIENRRGDIVGGVNAAWVFG